MTNLYLVPNWFFGMDVIFELAFALITLSLSFYSYKIYKLTNQNSSKLFSEAFLLFSISYFIQSFLNFAIISTLGENICDVVKLQSIQSLNLLGTYIHMFFFIAGLVTLTYMTLKTDNQKIFVLMLSISLLSLIISMNKIYWFFTVSSLLLVFILHHYAVNFSKNKNTNSFVVLLAFTFLLFAEMQFIFAFDSSLFYVVGHYLELVAYVLILTNLIIILRK
jgi:hypothetical protein